MRGVTELLNEVDSSDSNSTSELLPMVYHELRKLAGARLRNAGHGQTLQATALVHEVYLRLFCSKSTKACWVNRAEFFAAASESMRRIVIDLYRRKHCIKRGGGQTIRVSVDLESLAPVQADCDILAINEAIEALELASPEKALLVKLRYFCGMSMAESAQVLEVSLPTAERYWRYSRAFLANYLQEF